MRAEVTAADLSGSTQHPAINALAKAVQRALGPVSESGSARASVDMESGWVAVTQLTCRYFRLPPEARTACTMIKHGHPVRPFGFDLPADLVIPVTTDDELREALNHQ